MAADGISGAGSTSEQRFNELTGAVRAERAALGDSVLDGHYVEVKKASSTTINQVRAVKYLPLVVHRPADDEAGTGEQWWVVPAHEVVMLVHAKAGRGQHTENAYESATLSTNRLLPEHVVADPEQLRTRVLDAIAASDAQSATKQAMQQVHAAASALAKQSHRDVAAALRADGVLGDIG